MVLYKKIKNQATYPQIKKDCLVKSSPLLLFKNLGHQNLNPAETFNNFTLFK